MATREEAQTTVRGSILKMADDWNKPETIYHAIEAYATVIKSDPESKEASQARDALIKIAKSWEKDKAVYSALGLYKKLLFPQE